MTWGFPGGSVIKTLPSNTGGEGSIPGQRPKLPHVQGQKKKKKKDIKHKQYCKKFNKDFKNGIRTHTQIRDLSL